MTLLELSEPLFQYMCRLNRSARKGGNYELGQVQSEIKGFLADAKAKSVGENLSDQFDKIELPLTFFCDFMIKESALPWAREWKELAFERREMAGDEKFFDLLEETLKDKSPAANDRLTVFYTCIGLGFTGWYTSQPEYLRRKMKEVAARLQAAGMFSEAQRICADAYEKVDTRDLIEPPGTKLLGIAIILIGLIVVLFFMYGFLYRDSAKALVDDVKVIQDKSAAIGKETPK
jgi:type VI protein secretion system component VasF